MISASSNCSRIDAVKASANQIKLLKVPTGSGKDGNEVGSKSLKSDLQILDDSIKTGDARKAEVALSTVRSDIGKLDADQTTGDRSQGNQEGGNFRSFLAYA